MFLKRVNGKSQNNMLAEYYRKVILRTKKAPYIEIAMLCIFLTGCAVHPTARDQERSLQNINGDVRFTGSISEYLLERSALILAGKDVELEATYNKYDEKEGGEYIFKGHGPVNVSMAAALSNDGYFLTTAHSVDSNGITICYMAKGQIQHGHGRTIFKCPEIDVALVKADIKCEHWFDLNMINTPIGLKVLSHGGVQGDVAGGTVRRITRGTILRESIEIPFEKLKTSLPIGKGGSGSPIIDLDGQFHGICTDVWQGLLFKLLGYVTNVVKPSSSFLISTIEQDRKINVSEADMNCIN